MRLALVLAALLASAAASSAAVDARDVLRHYADLAQAGYTDSAAGAQTLLAAVDRLIAEPTEARLAEARDAWRAARVPYLQTEVFRFGNPIVDAWEVRVNAWPLDEGLIDYVDGSGASSENPYGAANIIANEEILVSGRRIDATAITRELLVETLNEAGGLDTNVTIGFHAVEFLLWGQDRNGTGPGAGRRPATDFDPRRCTGGACARRAAYLKVATGLLVDDLRWMAAQWAEDGRARRELFARDLAQGLSAIVTGMGSLGFGELAGERMKLALMLHDPEEEHDCFSDNTHWSFWYDLIGIRNVYTGRYARPDGSSLAGPGLSALVAASDPAADAALRERMRVALDAVQAIVDGAETGGVAFDQLIAPDHPAGHALVMDAIAALHAQTRAIEGVAAVLGVDTFVSLAGEPVGPPPQGTIE
jgi:putative iron-regulated protein